MSVFLKSELVNFLIVCLFYHPKTSFNTMTPALINIKGTVKVKKRNNLFYNENREHELE